MRRTVTVQISTRGRDDASEQKLRNLAEVKRLIAQFYTPEKLAAIFLPMAKLIANDATDQAALPDAMLNVLCGWATAMEAASATLNAERTQLNESDSENTQAHEFLSDVNLLPEAIRSLVSESIDIKLFQFTPITGTSLGRETLSLRSLMADFHHVYETAWADITEHLHTAASPAVEFLMTQMTMRSPTFSATQPHFELASPGATSQHGEETANLIHASRAITAQLNFEDVMDSLVTRTAITQATRTKAAFRFNNGAEIADAIIRGVCMQKVHSHPVGKLKVAMARHTIRELASAAVGYVTLGYNPAERYVDQKIKICGVEYPRMLVIGQVAGFALGFLHLALKIVAEYAIKTGYNDLKEKSEIGAEVVFYLGSAAVTTLATFAIAFGIQAHHRRKQAAASRVAGSGSYGSFGSNRAATGGAGAPVVDALYPNEESGCADPRQALLPR